MTTYTVSDSGSSDSGLSYDEAVERIAEWYEDSAEWATGSATDDEHAIRRAAIAGVDQPEETGGLADLRQYAASICEAIAEAGSREVE